MQERVTVSDGQSRGQGWYLSRGDNQYGPLTDRELSLFAEGGNFQTGDLLWTEGLDSWKPADAVFALTPSSNGSKRGTPSTNGSKRATPSTNGSKRATLSANGSKQAMPAPIGDPDVSAIVEALTAATEPPKATLKTKAIEELKKLLGIFLYLWVVFFVLLVHEWVVLSENHIGFTFYGLAAVNAIVLAKVMLVADKLRVAEQLSHKPLVYPIVYKAVAFTTLLFVAYVAEEILVGWFRGEGLAQSIPNLGGGPVAAFGIWLIFCIALVPFFAYKEFERAVGAAEFRALILGRGLAACTSPTRR
jgi:GYF domain 2